MNRTAKLLFSFAAALVAFGGAGCGNGGNTVVATSTANGKFF